jgi:hypothetical protein
MPRKTKKTKFVGLSLTEKDLEILDIYIKETNLLSRSEAARHCIQLSYNKEFPGYIYKTTPAGELKKRKLDEIKTFEQMSGEEYALSLGALVLASEEGTKWALFHQVGNSLKMFLVNDLKSLEADENFKAFVNYHKEVLKEMTIKQRIMSSPFWPKYLANEYDIVITNDQNQNQRDDDADPRLPVVEEHFSVAPERPADSGDEGGPDSGLPSRLEGGPTGHPSDNATDGALASDRSEDGEGPTPPSAGSLSDTIAKIRSHGPDSEGL